MSVANALDRFQRRFPVAGFPIAVVYKFIDDQGSYLAALITYYAFISLFPLLLLLSTILGIVLRGNPHLQHEVLNSALSQFPAIGQDLGKPGQLGGGIKGLVIGGALALYGGMGIGQAAQNAMNVAWAVPKNSRPNPLLARVRSLLLLATVGLAVLGTTFISALGSTGGAFGISLGSRWQIVLTVLSVLLNAGVFILAFLVAAARRLTLPDVAPGAILAAVIWQGLQIFGARYVDHVKNSSSATNSLFALVLGLLAFFYVASVAVVFCVEVNVVRVHKLHPRALLTPFTDNVDLTEGDQRVYINVAKAQRSKGFQEVDVRFHPHRHEHVDRPDR